MKLTVISVGKLRAGPEQNLIDDYVKRFGKTAAGIGGLTAPQIIEVDQKKRLEGDALKRAEAEAIRAKLPTGPHKLIALDERGKALSTKEFAATLSRWQDDGTPETVFLIGGADGLDKDLRRQADLTLNLGSLTWPHMLVRVMVAEQLYRAATVIAGHPYHRS